MLGALERILNFLKHFNKPPENGIAVFAGNISKNAGESDIKLFYIIPPDPITIQLYRCDSTFFLEPLLAFTKPKEAYGLVAIDGKEATIALLEGKNVRIVRRVHSTAPSKTHKGGQSARRYQRLVEEGKEEYYKRVGEAIDESFMGIDNFKGLIIGGPGPVKDYFIEGNYFNYQLKVLGKVDTGYSDDYGIQEMMQKIGDIIAQQEAIREKRIVGEFLEKVVKGNGATYGINQVLEALQEGRVDKLLISEELYLHRITYYCPNCDKREVKYILKPEQKEKITCKCGGEPQIEKDEDVIPELEDLAESTGAEIEFISTETTEGAQFYNGFLGIGAILRF